LIYDIFMMDSGAPTRTLVPSTASVNTPTQAITIA
jgi:hypothetical protein